ncbi:hypothetical protein ES703_60424 [subsurface metagenome]
MKVFNGIMFGIVIVLCGIGIGGGCAFFILVVMGIFEPLIGG